jgi:hypothetical protein
MTIINVEIPDDLDKEFRAKVYERKGLKRGAVTSSVIEALRDWTKKDTAPKP